MKVLKGDIWDYWRDGYAIVVPTNIGWTSECRNTMGAGLAKQLLDRYPGAIDLWYGTICKMCRHQTPVVEYETTRILLFPTKPLASKHWLSWKESATIKQITRSLNSLKQWMNDNPTLKVAIPLVGSGNGGLNKKVVLELLDNSKLNLTVVDWS